MYLNVFNSIILDEKVDLAFCLQNEYLCAALSPYEMSVIIPLMQKLLQCDSLAEMLAAAGWTVDQLMEEIPVMQETLDSWNENGLRLHEKYFLTFVFASAELESLRYHTCQICGADYFSKENESDVCDKCAADIYRNYLG